jgi:hydroxypyruvate isomerase
MRRREFTRALASTAFAAAVPVTGGPQANSNQKSGPLKLSVMLWTIYRDLPFEQRLEKVAEAGYHAVELVGEFKKWSEDDFRRANAKKRSLGITFDATAGLSTSIVDPRAHDAFLAELNTFVHIAQKLQCPAIIVLTGDRIESLPRQAQHDACVEALKRAADIVAKNNLTLLLENIDPEENPKYYLTSVAEGFEIVRKVDNPHVKFLYDFFHEQISEGNLIKKLTENIDLVGLVHVADVPGRHQPGTGEINYTNIYRKLVELKYSGYAAMEFIPQGDPIATLRAAREMVMRAVAA